MSAFATDSNDAVAVIIHTDGLSVPTFGGWQGNRLWLQSQCHHFYDVRILEFAWVQPADSVRKPGPDRRRVETPLFDRGQPIARPRTLREPRPPLLVAALSAYELSHL